MAEFKITIAGDSALNIEFGQSIEPETSATIRFAAQVLADDPIKGTRELIPTFCSLMVGYDPLVIGFEDLVARLQVRLRQIGPANLGIHKVTVIPTCYGGEYGPDIQTVADYAGVGIDEVIEIHTSSARLCISRWARPAYMLSTSGNPTNADTSWFGGHRRRADRCLSTLITWWMADNR